MLHIPRLSSHSLAPASLSDLAELGDSLWLTRDIQVLYWYADPNLGKIFQLRIRGERFADPAGNPGLTEEQVRAFGREIGVYLD